MKKLMILAAVALVAVASQAASFKWSAANIYGSDLKTKWSGTVTLYCTQVTDWSDSRTASGGVINAKNTEFSSDKFKSGNDYDFYFVIVDGEKTFTSGTKSVGAQESTVASIGFGNMAGATQDKDNWVSTPEPTSGLLLLLGVAGLALKRKQK